MPEMTVLRVVNAISIGKQVGRKRTLAQWKSCFPVPSLLFAKLNGLSPLVPTDCRLLTYPLTVPRV
jgi:hypothetical protein